MVRREMSFHLRHFWTFGTSWNALDGQFRAGYMKNLDAFLDFQVARSHGFYPNEKNIFAALEATRLDQVNVVILGQDPYPRKGLATGLAFAVPATTPIKKRPASLRAIFDEIRTDCGAAPKANGDLMHWTGEQGVLLLNRVLTVRAVKAVTHHRHQGWETFTEEVIKLVSKERSGVVFCLWGDTAIRSAQHIDRRRHYVLPANHPSVWAKARLPFSGCRHFSQVNALLEAQGKKQICW